jgi:ADP-L-glycero-D-manno-heptose 6-epimerase
MILLTGAAGFIASGMLTALNEIGQEEILLVDDFSPATKEANWKDKKFTIQVPRLELWNWIEQNQPKISCILHLGAKTDTTLMDYAVFERLNTSYSKKMWNYAVQNNIPFIYASSAATYGNGEFGYDDDESLIHQLVPLNPYGESKNDFDKWVLEQTETPPFWAGLKFFNVYGPNEYHKSRMASVIFHAYHQIKKNGNVQLFRSHRPDFKDGEQLRDFIYVKDVVKVLLYLMNQKPASGIYNLGTGHARSFNDLVNAIYHTLNLTPAINYIDTPIDIRDKYQYFTEANMTKLINAGYATPFYNLEEGVKDYVLNYLEKEQQIW